MKLAEAHGLLGLRVTEREQIAERGRRARARRRAPCVIDFRVEQEDSVYPMVPAGADLHDMIRRPSPIVETAAMTDDTLEPSTIMSKPRLRTFIAYVEDLPGVLNRVTSLFRRRNYNIDVAHGRPHRATRRLAHDAWCIEADDDAARRIEANLYKLVNVL